MSKITEEVEKLVSPIVKTLKLELVDIEYVKEGRDWFFVSISIRLKGISISTNVRK